MQIYIYFYILKMTCDKINNNDKQNNYHYCIKKGNNL